MKNNNSIVLVLELSQGCQLNCTGCKVNKEVNGVPEAETMEKLLSLFREMDQADMDFYELELGPTDMMSASNRNEILTNPQLRELAEMFNITAINSAFIHPKQEDYIAFAEAVHEFSPLNWIGLAIPIEMKHVFNEKYVERIRENVKVFQDHLPNFLKEVVLTVIFDEGYFNSIGNKHTYEELFERTNALKVHDNTMVDFIFHHGRTNIESEFVAESFKQSINVLNQQYLADIERRGDTVEYRHVPAQLLPESHNNELVLHRGELYIRPVLNERVTMFHDRMKFKGDWTLQEFRMHLHDRLGQNLEHALTLSDCKECRFQVECASNYVHDLMSVVKTEKCLLLRRELSTLNVKQELVLPD